MNSVPESLFMKIVLSSIAIGIWVLVLQNAGLLPGAQKVKAAGGSLSVEGTVDVKGSVKVENEVDINFKHLNGWEPANYYKYTLEGKDYHSLGVDVKPSDVK